jgi:methionyl-tRNA synthetase
LSSPALKPNFFVTTPIYYVNDVPHIGHAYCTIAADVLARWHRLQGESVLFSTGTDEHGQKIEKVALARGITPQVLVDEVAPRFSQLWDTLNIHPDDFVRTTEPRHEAVVCEFFRRVYAKGDIVLGHYEGLYCRPCESYYTETQAKENHCPECHRELERLTEESFFFKMNRYADRLLAHIDAHPNFLLPANRRNEVINLIKDGLPDLSISRVTCKWGIPVPLEINEKHSKQAHFIYVWFDALINYLTVAGGFESDSCWPATVHLVGKDIVKFHAIIWPIMLMAAGLELPEKVFGHGFITVGGEKMSKSKGNALAIEPLLEKFGVDPVRYFLLREIMFGQDGTVSEETLTNRYNADLANDLGNLLSRTLTMTEKYCGGKVPGSDPLNPPKGGLEMQMHGQREEGVGGVVGDLGRGNLEDQELISLTMQLPGVCKEKLNVLDFTGALQSMWQVIACANRYIETTAPWKLAKVGNLERVQKVLFNLLETLRVTADLISPFMPTVSAQMHTQLGTQPQQPLVAGAVVCKGNVLFPRIEGKV